MMQDIINMLKEFDQIPVVKNGSSNGERVIATDSALLGSLDFSQRDLLTHLLVEFDDCLICHSGTWNHTYWNELKAMAAHQGYTLGVQHGGDDNDSAGIETPHAIFWIDCNYEGATHGGR